MRLKDIKPNPNNPRLIKDAKFAKLVKSIKDFPKMMELRPIIIDDNNIVLGGNMRLKALKELKYKDIPDTWTKSAKDLTEEETRRFIIADNIGFGEHDWDILANEWDAKELEEWGLEGFPFEDEVLEAEEDDYTEPDNIKVDVVLGDLIEIGEHRLLCGDSTDSDQVAKLMNDEKAELLFTSPPYSDMREYNGNKDLSVSNIVEFITSFYEYCEYQVINLGIQRKDNDINQYWNDYIDKAKDNGYKFLSWNIWDKGMAGSIGNQSAFIPICHEWIFVFGNKYKQINRTAQRAESGKTKAKTKSRRQADGSMKHSSVGEQFELTEIQSVLFTRPELSEIRKSHPATFPIELPSEYIKAITNEGDLIAEPFTGSGTTMVAAHQLNRKCYGMELDPKYCQVIIDRMIKLDESLEVKINGERYEQN